MFKNSGLRSGLVGWQRVVRKVERMKVMIQKKRID